MYLWPFLVAGTLLGWLLYTWYRSVGSVRFKDSLLRAGLIAAGLLLLFTMFRNAPLLGALLSFLLFGLPLLRALRRSGRSPSGSASAGTASSCVETMYFRMQLDHASGAFDGAITAGRFSGRKLSDLTLDDLLFLRNECEADPQSVAVLEAYLDQHQDVDWRSRYAQRYQSSEAGSESEMDRQKAFAVLGLQPGADAEQIRAAHRRLVQRLHPDKGGSDYLIDELNRARDVLLGD